VHDLDELLRRRDRLELGDADGLLLDTLQELARQLKVDVGLEEDPPDLAQSFLDVGLGEDATPAQAGERRFEFFAQLVKHSV
jgi:hypothetical protein